jgi:prepilin-type N-terminal cleavage/methylation domain-containing protein
MEMKRRGFTMVETMSAVVVAGIVTFIVAQTSTMSARGFDKVSRIGSSADEGRRAMDVIVKDLRGAASALAKYPTTGVAAFTAEDDKTVILRLQKFDTANEPLPDQYKIVIYKLEAAPVESEGPFVIKRYTASKSGANDSTAVLDKVVCRNIGSMTFEFTNTETFTGNNSTDEFWFSDLPAANTANSKITVMVGGEDRVLDGYATLLPKRFRFAKPPSYGTVVDATYHVNPANFWDASASNTADAAFIKLVIRPRWKSDASVTKTRDITLTAHPVLVNKEDYL